MELTEKKNSIKILGLLIGIIIGLAFFLLPLKSAIIAVGGLIATLIILFYPEFGIYLLALAVPLVSLKYTLLLFVLTVFSFIIKLIVDKKFKIKKIPFGYSVIFFIIPLIASAMTSFTRGESFEKLVVYMISFVVLFLIVNLIDSKRKLYFLILTIIIASLLISFYGLYQYKVGAAVKESWVDKELNPDLRTRVYSTLDNPNILAEYLVMVIPLTFALFWTSKKKLNKLFFLLAVGVQFLCILLTFSRGGWLGLALAMIIFAFFVDRRLILLYIAAGIGLLIISPEVILTRIATIGNTQDTSTAYRFPLWMAALDMIRDFWITGVGLGPMAFKAIYPQYMRLGVMAVHTHNIFLQMFVETGIFGFIGFLVFIFNNMRCNLITFVKGIDKRAKIIAIAIFSSIAGLMLHGLVEYIFFDNKIIIMFWILLAIGMVDFKLEYNRLNVID
ncbi:O-antigen ligase family protein [Proteiniborus sp. MB09-C3]|uniref:O-antigen ligase family protein n=1 Tax=Proteiniborus sp. MB09-C3 TaxID=3050072 RepID=UPI00255219B0|nr:O-antigen ligase family protein [Proteiniborus sp. MB09-C3]WIV13463.1 O-antigen ligase family protein [Proteiniborus sp. MB09-C3]